MAAGGVGGQIQGISLDAFLQMAQMDKTTCTLTVKAGNQTGKIYVLKGELIDAETADLQGAEAAFRIVSWPHVLIEIENQCAKKENRVNQPLMNILMEGLRIRDEQALAAADLPPEQPAPADAPAAPPADDADGFKDLSRPAEKVEKLPRTAAAPAAPKPRKRSAPPLALILAGAGVLILAVAAVVVWRMGLFGDKGQKAFETAMAEVEALADTTAKQKRLEQFLADHGQGPHAQAARDKLEELRRQGADAELEELLAKVAQLARDQNFEDKARAAYNTFLGRHPEGEAAAQVRQLLAELPSLTEQIDFEALKALEGKGLDEQVAALSRYLTRHPDGANKAAVEKVLAGLANAMLTALQKNAKACDAEQNWTGCIGACAQFLNFFPTHTARKSVEELKTAMEGRQTLAALHAAAAQAGNDLAAARKVYTDYLTQHPASPHKVEVQAQMDRLKEQVQARGQWEAVQAYARSPQNDVVERHARVQAYLRQSPAGPFSGEAQKLLAELETQKQAELTRRQQQVQQERQQSALQTAQAKVEQERQKFKGLYDQVLARAAATGRFSAAAEGVTLDGKTGLMWTLLDSTEQIGRCLDHASARNWVQALSIGGFTDWRLPTASELAAIYKTQPFFPAGAATWYWSSEAYVKGYHTVVNIVTTKAETVFRIEQERAETCGAVRAVRP